MLTLQVGFRLLELWSEITLEVVKKATPEQVQAILARHEQRVSWLMARIDKIKGEVSEKADSSPTGLV